MDTDRTPRWPQIRHALVACAIVGMTGALLVLTATHHRVFDWTGNTRHSLGEASRAAIAALKTPVGVTVYLPPRHPARETAKTLIARYRRADADITLHFVDPAAAPEAMRTAGLREGEMVVTLEGREEHLRTYSEGAFTNALAKLARNGQQWLGFVSGHGERSPTREANFDLSDFAQALKQRGIRARELNLAAQGALPDNLAALVIASPQVEFMPGEVALLRQYLDRGGALLWLLEPQVPVSLGPLAKSLGLTLDPRTVIDPTTAAMAIDDPAMSLVTQYREHLALSNFSATTVLPHAAPVAVTAEDGWTPTLLFASGPRAWAESSPVAGNVAFDDGVDTRGPLPLAQALTRKQQRVVVVGDGDFLSNTYLGNGGNRDLGTRLVEWVAANDALIAVDAVPAPDRKLALKPWQVAVLGGGFLIALPLAFLLNGLVLWWHRRA